MSGHIEENSTSRQMTLSYENSLNGENVIVRDCISCIMIRQGSDLIVINSADVEKLVKFLKAR